MTIALWILGTAAYLLVGVLLGRQLRRHRVIDPELTALTVLFWPVAVALLALIIVAMCIGAANDALNEWIDK